MDTIIHIHTSLLILLISVSPIQALKLLLSQKSCPLGLDFWLWAIILIEGLAQGFNTDTVSEEEMPQLL